MTDAHSKEPACLREEVAAYLDGELDERASRAFEQHLQACRLCATELREQRRLLCTLDMALGPHDEGQIALPENFSQVVAAHAQSDLGGLRQERSERRRALRLCLLLAASSFLLLGGALLSEGVLKPLGLLVRHAGTVLGFIGRALYGFGTGLAVIARAFGRHTIFESQGFGVFVLLLLGVSAVLLPRLISSYHRTRLCHEESAASHTVEPF